MEFKLKTQHQCSVLPIETKWEKIIYTQVQGYAGYNKIKLTRNLSECPVCGKQYPYGPTIEQYLGKVSYQEVEDLKGKL